MRQEYGSLERAYGRMLFGWQETCAGDWQKGGLYENHEKKGKKERKNAEDKGGGSGGGPGLGMYRADAWTVEYPGRTGGCAWEGRTGEPPADYTVFRRV